LFGDELDDLQTLFRTEGRRLAGRAARHEEMNAGVDLPPREAADGLLVKGPGAGEWRDERRPDARECESHVISKSCPGGFAPADPLRRRSRGPFAPLRS